jgi:hypothetical protein
LITEKIDYNNTELDNLNELGFDLAFKMAVEHTPEYGYYEVFLRKKV